MDPPINGSARRIRDENSDDDSPLLSRPISSPPLKKQRLDSDQIKGVSKETRQQQQTKQLEIPSQPAMMVDDFDDFDDDIPLIQNHPMASSMISTASDLSPPGELPSLIRPTANEVTVKKHMSEKSVISPIAAASEVSETKVSTKGRRTLTLTEENFEPINCWWEKEAAKDGTQWSYLEHHGIMFTPAYESHCVPVIYKNEKVVLPPEAEEVANYWCAAIESDYGKKEKFRKNFWSAFMSKLPSDNQLKMQKAKFEDVDFTKIKTYIDDNREAIKEKRKNFTKLEKEAEKTKKDAEEGPFMYALFDWLREKVGSYKAEPPSLFRGRGEHPKMGQLKRRIFPEEVTLNCHADAPVPRLPAFFAGHSWKDVFHDNTVSWLGYYKDSVNGHFKYVFLGAGSAVKGQKDHMKYEKARKLKNHIDAIRKDYNSKIRSDDLMDRQLGTATYMLDVLALRVGNEKDSSEEADTVGCCSLRVEHISFDEENAQITLDFLGKDSIRYLNTVKVHPLVLKNLMAFCKRKGKDEDIFDQINPSILNKYLKDMMPGLSAKVFRTFNASKTLQQELEKLDPQAVDISNSEAIKQFYDSANRAVAILCNHQRSIPKQHESSMDKMKLQLNKIEEDIKEVQAYLKYLKGNQNKAFKYIPSTQNKDAEPITRQSVVKPGMREDIAKKKMDQLLKKRGNHELKMRMKDENKTVSNATSKQHYMDPRITVAFCKKWELPIEKLFNTGLRKKFPWAMYAHSDFSF